MSKIKEYFQGLVKESVIPQEPANYDAATLKIYIDHLEAENAALRERLSKSVEFPRVETSPYDENDSFLYYIENNHIQCECFNNKFPEQLENKLKELIGEGERT